MFLFCLVFVFVVVVFCFLFVCFFFGDETEVSKFLFSSSKMAA